MSSRRVWIVLVVTLFVGAAARPSSAKRTPEDRRLDEAAEHFVAGRVDKAREILESIPEAERVAPPRNRGFTNDDASSAAERRRFQAALLGAAIHPGTTDAFDLLVQAFLECDREEDPFTTSAWGAVFARFAIREGYPAAARGSFGLGKYQERRDLREAMERELARATPAPEPSAPAADPIAAGLRRRLTEPARVVFTEGPLEPTYAPLRSSPEAWARAKAVLATLTFPPSFEAARAETRGDDVVAIGASQDYDPTGEVSRGAYWVIRSHDGGRTWGKPLYTGLGIRRPYVVQPLSNAPLLDGDRLQIEARIDEIDDESITLPPIELRSKRTQDGLLLRAAFTDLERDGDQDGLTDLAEERLLTDPVDADTDHDGVADAVDSLPLVPLAGGTTDTGALSAALANITGTEPVAILTDESGHVLQPDALTERARSAVLSTERTVFVVGDRADFRGLLTTRRVVVLTDDELALVVKRFWTTYPLRLSVFFLDREGKRGFLVWDRTWAGGALELKKEGSSWSVEVISEWIT